MEIAAIDTGLLTRQPLAVRIIKVESPTLIWVHLENGGESFYEMEQDLNIMMERRARYLVYQPDDIKTEEIVVVKDKAGWRRGYVVRTSRRRAYVALKDWGRCIWVAFRHCHPLPEQFRERPWQAIPCGLAYVGPKLPVGIWSPKAKDVTRAIAEGHFGWITIQLPVQADTGALVDLSIRNEAGDGNYDLADTLSRLGLLNKITKIAVDIYPAV